MLRHLSRRLARGAIRLTNWLVDGVVLSVLMLIVLFTAYSVLDNNRVAEQAEGQVFESYRPDSDDDPTFDELVALNPDVVGWLTLYGTGVDYPLVQGEDNDEYLNTNPAGEFALSGSLFLDWRNASDFSDQSTIVFGHHMENSLMFGDLDRYGDDAYFDQHRYGNIYYGGANHGLEVAAYLLVDAYDQVVYSTTVGSSPTTEEFLAYLKAHAGQWVDGSLAAGDHMLVLSTCGSGTNDRHVVVARITDQTFEDTFVEETVERTLAGTVSEGLQLWAKIGIALLVFLLLAWVVGSPSRKRARGAGRGEKE